MSTLKILSDTHCMVRCDFQEVGNIQAGELYKLQLKRGCYILEFLVEDIVICSMDYTIETNDEEPLLRLNIKEQAEKKIMERKFASVFSEDGRSILGCNKCFEGVFIVPEGIERIERYAFSECEFTSVNIPNSVKSIGDYAFIHCHGLTLLTIPNSVTSIGEGAFLHCSGLTSLTIPNSVKSIGEDVFSHCSGLTSITIPNSVTSIGTCAFVGCSGLTSITIPNSVTSIGAYAFSGCDGLTSVHISDIAVWCKIDFCELYSNPLEIAHHLFLNGEEIKDLVIPNNVTSIEGEVFSGCSGLTSIIIPNSVTSIGEGTFSHCSGLTSVTIPNSLTSIGEEAFCCCSGLTSIVVEEGNTKYDSRNICNAIIESSSNTLIAGCKNTTIPNSVTAIGSYAFLRCSGLTSVTIPNSVTSIGKGAFKYCSGLTSVTIPNSVTSIEEYAFSGCSGLTSITIPNSVTSIGAWAFSGCYGLTSITIPNSLTLIGAWAFNGCHGLTSVTIPNSVTSIGTCAFRCCSGLTSVTIPNSVRSIEVGAFSLCSGLTSITIPNSVTSIEGEAFDGCPGLTSITIPNSVTLIGKRVFLECVNLKEIIIPKGTRKKFEDMLPDQKDKLVEYEQLTIKRTKDNKTFFFFDTETTGVPLNYKAPSSDTNNWPRLVQLAWILTDQEGNRIHTGNLIVKPEGFIIPTDATRVHGITTQRANEEGVPLTEAIEQFKADLDLATYIVGHNVDFDKKIVGAEMIRLGMKDELEKKKSYCTMLSSIDFCKIPGKYGYKYPKLQELYKKLFGNEFDDAHNAMSDIEATEQCFWELRKRKLI